MRVLKHTYWLITITCMTSQKMIDVIGEINLIYLIQDVRSNSIENQDIIH